jgi:hypothetical protein
VLFLIYEHLKIDCSRKMALCCDCSLIDLNSEKLISHWDCSQPYSGV